MNDHISTDSQSQIEYWKPIPDFEEIYEISNLGRVRTRISRKGTVKGAILNPEITEFGYKRITLTKDKVRKRIMVHRLVLLTFVGDPPEDKTDTNHKNKDRSDNRLCNLEWVTPSENMYHSYSYGNRGTARGSGNGNAKLSEEDILQIRKLYAEGQTQSGLARIFDVTQVTIWRVVHGNSWKHVT